MTDCLYSCVFFGWIYVVVIPCNCNNLNIFICIFFVFLYEFQFFGIRWFFRLKKSLEKVGFKREGMSWLYLISYFIKVGVPTAECCSVQFSARNSVRRSHHHIKMLISLHRKSSIPVVMCLIYCLRRELLVGIPIRRHGSECGRAMTYILLQFLPKCENIFHQGCVSMRFDWLGFFFFFF